MPVDHRNDVIKYQRARSQIFIERHTIQNASVACFIFEIFMCAQRVRMTTEMRAIAIFFTGIRTGLFAIQIDFVIDVALHKIGYGRVVVVCNILKSIRLV